MTGIDIRTSLQYERLRPRPCKRQRCKHPRWAKADDDGRTRHLCLRYLLLLQKRHFFDISVAAKSSKKFFLSFFSADQSNV